jgi:hypothetical protein
MAHPNIMPICSAYATAREVARATGYEAHLRILGDFGDTTPNYAFDGDLNTFWADLTTKEQSWVGLDVTTQVMDIKCVRIVLAGIKVLQHDHTEMQAWDGMRWATKISAVTPWTRALPFAVPLTTGNNFQRRPSPPRSLWRLENDIAVTGWEVMEVEFYMFVDCSGQPMAGTAISSITEVHSLTQDGGHNYAAMAFDQDRVTRWTADCKNTTEQSIGRYIVPVDNVCKPSEAWIGIDADVPTSVTCFRIIQSGRRNLQASKLALSMWNGEEWEVQGRYAGFGGESWNRRPAPPDTLWRISLVQQKTELCPSHGRGMDMRSWGVSEIEFFADDECSIKLPGIADGANVIVSGTREPNVATRSQQPQFDPNFAFDGDIKTYWAAQCGNIAGSDATACADGFEWIGLDFSAVAGGQPRDVRCFKIHQNRNSRRECCDPAEVVRLDRWNGTEWAEASWRHVPLSGAAVKTIDARFERMGMCPMKVTSFLPGGSEDYWEVRKRRQAETCEIGLAAAVKLLSEPLCEKHDACKEAGFTGQCCPAVAVTGLSRCCCDFLMSGIVFEDELTKDANRENLETAPATGLEFIIIKSTVVLPFLGLAISIIFFILGNVPQPWPQQRCFYRPWMAICGPFQRWMAAGASPGAVFMRFFIVRYKGERVSRGRLKSVGWICCGFFGGGCVFWLLISYVIAEAFIKLTVVVSMVIPLWKSPYSPGDPADRKRMAVMLAIPFEKEAERGKVKLSDSPLGDVASKIGAAIVMWLCYVLRAMFDFILMRFAVLSLDLVDVTISIPEILYSIPKMPINITGLQDLMYTVVSATTFVFQEAFLWLFEGVPRCEGPVILFSGMWLVSVTLVLIRWLNYDLFGIFTSTKNVVQQTRPMFQKTCGMCVMLGCQAFMFLFMQCIMLIFVRALKLVNPMEQSNQQWTCPYEGDFMSVLVGRILLTTAALIALVITFLCANGHFLGQDYIVKEYSKWIDMNLSGLDPDGVGDEGGFIRFDSFLAMIPTTFGIWIDGWNVQGYLIKQRAMVYAEEMMLPIECPICECAHVPYQEIMRATGMQLSLAYQLAPAGAIIGKCCEYMNNPPMFYYGSELKCFHAHRHMRHAMEGVPKKMQSGQMMVVAGTLFLAFCKDILFPLFVRLSALGLYITLVYMTFVINKDNVDELAATAFKAISALAMSKAVLEFVLPAVLIIVFFLLMKSSAGSNGAEAAKQKSIHKKESRNAWPVVGAAINGYASGTGVALFFYLVDPFKFPAPASAYAIFCGTLCGIIASIVSLLLGLILERCPGSRTFGAGILFAYLVSTSFGLGWLGTSKYYLFTERMFMSVGTCMVLVAVSAYTFWPEPLPRGGPKAARLSDPVILPVITGPRILSAPMGVIAGVFATMKVHKLCLDLQGTYYGFGTAVLVGVIVSLIYSLATDSIVEKRSAQVAIGVGTFTSLIFGVYVEWYVGVAIGSVVGCILGAIIEHYTFRAVSAETILMQPGDAQPYKATLRTDGTTVFPGQPVNPQLTDPAASNLPTLVNATPRSESNELKLYSNAPDETFNKTGTFSNISREQTQQLMVRVGAPHGRGKRFGLHHMTGGEVMSPSNTNIAWTSGSPSQIAVKQGWVGDSTQSHWQGASGRSNSSPPGTGGFGNTRGSGASTRGLSQDSARGAAQGGLPVSPNAARGEPRH